MKISKNITTPVLIMLCLSFGRILSAHTSFASLNLYQANDYQQALAMPMKISIQAQINSLTKYFPTLYLTKRLKHKFLNNLIQTDQWELFLRLYPKETTSVDFQCAFLHARLTLFKKIDEILLKKLWHVGHFQPRSCANIFDHGLSQGIINGADIWQRYLAAYNNGNESLKKYLKNKLPPPYTLSTAHMEKLEKSLKHIHKVPKSKKRELGFPVLMHLANKNPDVVLKYLPTLASFNLTSTQISIIKNKLLYYYAKRKLKKTMAISVPKKLDLKTNLALIRYWLYKQEWQQVQKFITQLPEEVRRKNRWQYWTARSLHHLKQPHQAILMLTKIAKERDYYGMLASHMLRQSPPLNHKDYTVNEQRLKDFQSRPLIRLIQDLKLKKPIFARLEWRNALKYLSVAEKKLATEAAHRWSWHHDAIWSAKESNLMNDLFIRFPTPYDRLIHKHTKTLEVPKSLVWAIMRQESAFNPQALSPKGATGLMQLMPSTAAMYTGKTNISTLYKPDVNIKVGTMHLAYLLKQFNNQLVYTIASYNAGQSRVKHWLSRKMPLDVWIETIPFNETRQYVQNVLTYYTIYQNRLGKTHSFNEIFPHQSEYFSIQNSLRD